jgi:hypothetical protein
MVVFNKISRRTSQSKTVTNLLIRINILNLIKALQQPNNNMSFDLFLDGFFLASFLGVVGDGCVFCGSLGFWLGL